MFRFGQRQLWFICCVVLFITGYLMYWKPDYSFFDGGLITAILITIFIKHDAATRWVGFICAATVLMIAFMPHQNPDISEVFLEQSFSFLLVISAVLVVLYVKRLYRTVEREESQLNALFQHATEGILLTNSLGEIVLINPEVERLFLYKTEELLGQKIEVLIPHRLHGKHEHYRDTFQAHPASRNMGQGRDLFALRKDGSEFPVEVSLSYFRQDENQYVLAFIIDITLRKQAENNLLQQKKQLEQVTKELVQLNQELEGQVDKRTVSLKETLERLEQSQAELRDALHKEKELNEIKSRFVSMASHEFRTPLSAILSSASLVAKYTTAEEQPKRERHVQKIRASVRHLNELLEDFLSLGKLEDGKVHLVYEPIDLASFAEEVTEELQTMLKEGQLLLVDVEPGIHLSSDRRLLKQIMINLLTNAVKFSAAGAEVRWEMRQSGERLSVWVADQGIGIPEEDRHYLFSSFFRAKNVTNVEGTGLGLHIVKRYVDLLNGFIDIESELGKGTTVHVKIPLFNQTDYGNDFGG